MSDLYTNVACIFDDPLALACALRELHRRQNAKLLLPPLKRVQKLSVADLTLDSWVFLSFRGGLRRDSNTVISDREDVDSIFEVFNDGSGWFVRISANGTEVGPFDSSTRAFRETRSIATGQGYTCLESFPWDEEDLTDYPL